MRITKRQLKRIIREEYSRLKRRELIKEDWMPNPEMGGDDLYPAGTKLRDAIEQAVGMIRDEVGDEWIQELKNKPGRTARTIEHGFLGKNRASEMRDGWGGISDDAIEAIQDTVELLDIEGSGNYQISDPWVWKYFNSVIHHWKN